MLGKKWRVRLKDAVEKDGRSLRAISLDARNRLSDADSGPEKVGEAYVWELLNTDKEPSIGRLGAVCDALNVPISTILEGIELSPESARLLRAFGRMTKDEQEAFLDFLERRSPQ